MMFYVALLLGIITLTTIQGECPEGCKERTLIYDGLGCKAIYKNPKDCCPIKFDCSHFEKAETNKCMLQGKFYNTRDLIPENISYPNCRVNCICEESTKFRCASLDCPEWLGYHPEPGCHLKYNVGECCSAGKVCPEKEHVESCKVGANTYLEGQRFSAPDQMCLSCVCQKGFAGKFEEPFCRKNSCTDEIDNSNDIRNNCAAVYRDNDYCCPWDWMCPKDDDKIIASKSGINNPDMQCKFGGKFLNIGDTLDRLELIGDTKREETSCECKTPPFVTCIRKWVYPEQKLMITRAQL